MFLFRKFLLLFILICFLTPFTVFGMCSQAFSEFTIELKLPKTIIRTLYDDNIHTIEDLTAKTSVELMQLAFFEGKYLRKIETGLAKRGMNLASFPFGPLDLLNISNHTKTSLYYGGIRTIEALASKTPVELMKRFNDDKRLYYARRKMLNEVKAALAKRGLSLATIAPLSPLISMDTLGLSYNIRNIFRYARIYTIEDLTSKTIEELMKLPDFGREYLKQVQEILADGGLQLAPPSDPSSVNSLGFSIHVRNALSNAEVYTIKDLTSKTAEALTNSGYFRRKSLKEIKTVLSEQGLSLAFTPFDPSTNVNTLGLSPKIKNIFHNSGIHTIGDLISKTAEELMANLPDFGKASITQVQMALAERELHLASAPR